MTCELKVILEDLQ